MQRLAHLHVLISACYDVNTNILVSHATVKHMLMHVLPSIGTVAPLAIPRATLMPTLRMLQKTTDARTQFALPLKPNTHDTLHTPKNPKSQTPKPKNPNAQSQQPNCLNPLTRAMRTHGKPISSHILRRKHTITYNVQPFQKNNTHRHKPKSPHPKTQSQNATPTHIQRHKTSVWRRPEKDTYPAQTQKPKHATQSKRMPKPTHKCAALQYKPHLFGTTPNMAATRTKSLLVRCDLSVDESSMG